MELKYKVLVYNHNPKYVDKYEKLIKDSRSDLCLLICKNEEEIDKSIEQADIIFSGHTFPVKFLSKARRLK